MLLNLEKIAAKFLKKIFDGMWNNFFSNSCQLFKILWFLLHFLLIYMYIYYINTTGPTSHHHNGFRACMHVRHVFMAFNVCTYIYIYINLWLVFFFFFFYELYHQGLSRYCVNKFCSLVSWESQTDYFFDGNRNQGQELHF